MHQRVRPAVNFAVIITNYNYGRFVVEAVESALAQTRAPRQVLVVDDGSTDDSVDRLRARYAGDPRVTLLLGPNLGQLGAFKRGIDQVDADVVAFLDADDRWGSGYLARLGEIYDERRDVDFIFTDINLFDREQGLRGYATRPVDLGFTALATWMTGWWYGEATSALSMRRRWAQRSLDLPPSLQDSWRISADTLLVFGSSMLGARKYFLPTGAVYYRVHGENGWWHSREQERHFQSRYQARSLINCYAREMAMDARTTDLVKLEFLSKPDPSRDEARRYAMMALRSEVGLARRLWRAYSIVRRGGAPERRAERAVAARVIAPPMPEPLLAAVRG